MQITVFGGSGFLGSHVCDKLSLKGFKVIVFDKKKSPWLKKNQKMVIGDINDIQSLKKSIQGSSVVYNFAGLADIDESKNNPIETIKQNILGNSKIIEEAVKGMLPKNKLGKSMIKKLKVFSGPSHDHESQQPTEWNPI